MSKLSPPDAATRVVRGACPHDCPDTCALRITVQDGRAIKVQGDPDHPPTHGALCTKVSRYAERSYHPERVLHPMKRVGPKGSGSFVRVSWEDALADTAVDRRQAIDRFLIQSLDLKTDFQRTLSGLAEVAA